ncbi:hypothetical protein V8E36_005255 [Tilletia maclaganii]
MFRPSSQSIDRGASLKMSAPRSLRPVGELVSSSTPALAPFAPHLHYSFPAPTCTSSPYTHFARHPLHAPHQRGAERSTSFSPRAGPATDPRDPQCDGQHPLRRHPTQIHSPPRPVRKTRPPRRMARPYAQTAPTLDQSRVMPHHPALEARLHHRRPPTDVAARRLCAAAYPAVLRCALCGAFLALASVVCACAASGDGGGVSL